MGHGAVPAQVGVDEKAAGKGRDYITMVSDLDAGTVDYIADERRQASLDGYFYRFTPEQLAVTGDKSLAGSKYLWLYSAENLPARHQDRFAALRASDLQTARAWAIKEDLRHFWSYRRRGWAAKHFTRWYF